MPYNYLIDPKAGRCRLPVSESGLKAPTVSALEANIRRTAFKIWFQIHLAPLHQAARANGLQDPMVGRCRLNLSNPH
jgi:hypothetical protein